MHFGTSDIRNCPCTDTRLVGAHLIPLGSKPPGAKPKAAVPGQATFKPFSKIHKEMHKIKGGQPMLHPTPPKASPAMKSKVVWKQTVTW